MENISRGPTFGDFVTIRIRTSQLQDHRVKEYRPPPPCNAPYYVRVSLWTVKIFLAQHKSEGGRG
jgi:hypothetical protein